MNFLNIYGLFFMIIIMIPNIVFAIKHKNKAQNIFKNKIIEMFEQIGRFGCILFMIFIIPNITFGFASTELFVIYLTINSVLISIYSLIWIICFKTNSVFRALTLSIIPSVIFLFSGITSRCIPLTISALIFAPCHIFIS